MRKIIFVDIDNTICKTNGLNYSEAIPEPEAISIVNKWYDNGHYIVYWTARGFKSAIDYSMLTKVQLSAWGCKYHELRLDKPLYDVFFDDRAYNAMQLIDHKLE